MSRSTISTFQLFEMFPDAESARLHIESQRWPDGAVCPFCGTGDRITTRKGGFYRCNACREDFTVRTGTVFERSHIPLNKWLYAMYLMMTARKGISSMQLAKEIGITQKSAWFMLGRLREACGGDTATLNGIVEIDETYVGGRSKNMHAWEREKKITGTGGTNKSAVLGIRERGGRTKAKPIAKTDQATLRSEIVANIEAGATLHTDDFLGYRGIDGFGFVHETVNHRSGEYERDGVHTNGIESVWAVLKRGLYGVYHHASPKHLHRYVDEAAFRLNEGKVERHTLDRLESLTEATFGKRLTYKALIG
jgi:transposase-like protein